MAPYAASDKQTLLLGQVRGVLPHLAAGHSFAPVMGRVSADLHENAGSPCQCPVRKARVGSVHCNTPDFITASRTYSISSRAIVQRSPLPAQCLRMMSRAAARFTCAGRPCLPAHVFWPAVCRQDEGLTSGGAEAGARRGRQEHILRGCPPSAVTGCRGAGHCSRRRARGPCRAEDPVRGRQHPLRAVRVWEPRRAAPVGA